MGDEGDITRLLERWARGDEEALRILMPMVYGELKDLAEHYLRRERAEHTLQPTALVHEAYLRLVGQRAARLHNRTHFYGAAAQVMRRVLVDHARRRAAAKRQGDDVEPVLPIVSLDVAADVRVDLVALDDALLRLEAFAPDRAKVVELRYFGGLSIEETAAFLRLGEATVKRRWNYARAWLYRELTGAPNAVPRFGLTPEDPR
jgi:RNA polymerase sigma factor (TIGR02999 family)